MSPPRRLLTGGLVTAGLLVGGAALCQTVPTKPLEFRPAIEAAHPGVPWISTSQLSDALSREPAPVLLDVRTQAEFDVSHIAGARRVEPGSDGAGLDLPRDRPVVVYCSVGYRSARLGRSLLDQGYSVRNLAGGVFQWVNEGRALVDDGGKTDLVHPYDATWGLLVEPAHRARLD